MTKRATLAKQREESERLRGARQSEKRGQVPNRATVRGRDGRKKTPTPREGAKRSDDAGFHDSHTTALYIIFLIALSRIFQGTIKVILRFFLRLSR